MPCSEIKFIDEPHQPTFINYINPSDMNVLISDKFINWKDNVS